MNILVTGASGFIGQALVPELLKKGHLVRATYRLKEKIPPNSEIECVAVGDIGPQTNWQVALAGIDTVIHLAGRAHVMDEKAVEPLSEYRRINTAGTRRLAGAALQAGVRRMIFLSTVKVNGEETFKNPFTVDDIPNPQDAYAISKCEAEQALMQIAQRSGLEIVVLRLPLVYGPGVKGNFLAMLKVVHNQYFLPLASIDNRRSLIYLGNLVDIISICVVHPDIANKIFMVSDGEDVSTPELIRSLAQSMSVQCRLIPFPIWGLKTMGRIGNSIKTVTGRRFPLDSEFIRRLINSLTVDSRQFQELTGWKPRYTLSEGLRLTVEWYSKNYKL